MNQLDVLLEKIYDSMFTVSIIGLGYVGLPLMWTFHQQGMPVIGYDIDTKKVENLKNGISYIKHLGTEMMETLANSNKADATTDFSRLDEAVSEFDAVLISTNHSTIDYAELAEWSECVCVIDTRNAMSGIGSKGNNHIFKA